MILGVPRQVEEFLYESFLVQESQILPNTKFYSKRKVFKLSKHCILHQVFPRGNAGRSPGFPVVET